jgi:hypothetical protein
MFLLQWQFFNTGIFLKIRFAQWVLLKLGTLLMLGCASTGSLDTINQLHFKTIGRIPVIEGTLNGKRAFFIIDTGASVSLLDESVSDHFGFKVICRINHQVEGLGGSARLSQAFNYRVQLGTLNIKNIQFHTKNMSDFVAVIRESENIDIAGIIGSDVFDRYKIAIDYRRNTISY